jgi:hypothetical protein
VKSELLRRDEEENYFSDGRDGQNVTDSDEEFQMIVDMDAIINKLIVQKETNQQELTDFEHRE